MMDKQTYQVPMTTSKVQEMTKMALCVALLAVAAYISFPLPFTPAMVTGLTVAVNLVAFILPPKQALIVMIIYVLLGAVGVPVFVGGTAGLGKIFGPTGGFIIGFVVAAFVMSLLRGNSCNYKKMLLLGIAVGMPIIYVGGCISMYAVAGMSVWKTLIIAVFPFIIGDVLKVILAAFLADRLNAIAKR